MGTDRPRFSVTMSEEMYDKINQYQHENRFSTQTKAISKLLEIGLKSIQEELNPPIKAEKTAPSELSEEAQQVAQDYSQLDQPGKNVVRVVIQEEGKRVKAEKEKRQVPAFEPQTVRRIPLYFTPAAAGMMSPAEGQDYEMIEVGKDVPWNADFAVKIDGESMEPYIRDGSTVYVNREPLENGDVGIFYVDGNMICKQYYKDEDGNVRLLSLNRACRYADRYISVKDTDTVMMYYGRVLLPRRPMVSWA